MKMSFKANLDVNLKLNRKKVQDVKRKSSLGLKKLLNGFH